MPGGSTRKRSLRILITAGPTREYIDPVRYISNDSSGKMGFAIAAAAARRGHRVTLVAGPVALRTPSRVRRIDVTSAAQMLAACEKAWRRCDVLVAAAAVADYTPAEPSPTKRKKSAADLVLRLRSTSDILAILASRKTSRQRLIGFALEDRNPRRNAAEKLRRKGLDAIILNRPAAIGADRSAIEILTPESGWRRVPAAEKTGHANIIVDLLERLFRIRRER